MMQPEKKGGRKKAVLAVILIWMFCLWVSAFLFHGSAKANWKKVFRFCGLGDFSDCADDSPFSLHVLDVGKADSILAECSGHFLLIDGGTPDSGANVADYLKERNVKKIDLVINTHPDNDHIGGLKTVLQTFSVKRYLCPQLPEKMVPKTQEYQAVQSALKRRGLISEHPKSGTLFTVGLIKVEILGPVKQGESTNDNSIVTRLTFGKTSFLLTGDAGFQEENSIISSGIDLKADVLKVGHHGSSTSTSQPFLEAVAPKYAVISVGNDSSKLPRVDVSQRLKTSGITVYRTDRNGTVIFLSDGKTVRVQTQKS